MNFAKCMINMLQIIDQRATDEVKPRTSNTLTLKVEEV